MKRRTFIKSSTLLGAGAGSLGAINACKPGESPSKIYETLPGAGKLDALENEFTRFTLFHNGSAEILDKKNQKIWRMAAIAIQDDGLIDESRVWLRAERTLMEQYPARFVVNKQGNIYQYELINRQKRVKGQFTCRFFLEGPWLRFQLLEISKDLPSLIFPPPILSEKVVIPHHAGRLVHKEQADIWTRQFLPFFTHLNMKWLGGLEGEHAWMAVFGKNVLDAGGFLANNQLTAGWLKKQENWGGNYSLSYRFVKGDHVQLAKTYREYLKSIGRFKSLEEKIDENPSLEHMLGGRTLSYFQAWPSLPKENAKEYWFNEQQMKNRVAGGTKVDFTHADVAKSLEYVQQLGFKKGLVALRGWINGGYDASHPDIWPPEPLLGSLNEMKQLMQTGKQVVTGLHDNYQDIYEGYPSFPKGINIRPNGDWMHGGLWAGGQAYILNSRNALEYAARNWEIMKELGPGAMFIDTATASKLEQSYEKGNRLSRAQDLQHKMDLLHLFKKDGALVGSEEGNEYGNMLVDYSENRHARHAGETIPLWSLVFHDSVFSCRYITFEPGSNYPRWLEDMLWGYHLHFFMKPGFGNIRKGDMSSTVGFSSTELTEDLFQDTFKVDKWHEKIGLLPMTHHRFLTADASVEETVFGEKYKIICNFNAGPVQVNQYSIPGHGYIIEGT